MEALPITDAALDALRASVSAQLGERRLAHTLAVEKEIAFLATRFLPEMEKELRAAALLHDLTKELSFDEQMRICEKHGIDLPSKITDSPAVLHSFSAPPMIREKYPLFATEQILRAIARHTVGHSEMSTFDKLLFLADYIEPTRKPISCQSVRADFYGALAESGSEQENLRALDNAVFAALQATITYLERSALPILPESYEVYKTFRARVSG